jgi:hypothetical protein
MIVTVAKHVTSTDPYSLAESNSIRYAYFARCSARRFFSAGIDLAAQSRSIFPRSVSFWMQPRTLPLQTKPTCPLSSFLTNLLLSLR